MHSENNAVLSGTYLDSNMHPAINLQNGFIEIQTSDITNLGTSTIAIRFMNGVIPLTS